MPLMLPDWLLAIYPMHTEVHLNQPGLAMAWIDINAVDRNLLTRPGDAITRVGDWFSIDEHCIFCEGEITCNLPVNQWKHVYRHVDSPHLYELEGNQPAAPDPRPAIARVVIQPIVRAKAPAAPAIPALKTGDRVKLPKLPKYDDSPSNPAWGGRQGNVIGTVAYSGTAVNVAWDNGENNVYMKGELQLAEYSPRKIPGNKFFMRPLPLPGRTGRD